MATKQTAVYSVKEAYAYPLIDDQEGSKPIYARGIRVVGMQTVTVTKNYSTDNLEADDTILDVQSSLESVDLSVEYGRANDALSAILEGGIHTLLSDESRYVLSGQDEAGFFGLKFRGTKLSSTGQDKIVTLFKVKSGTTESETGNKAFRTNTFDAGASQLNGDAGVHPNGNEIILEQTRDAGSAASIDPNSPFPAPPGDTTAPTLSSTTPADSGSVAVAGPVVFVFSEELADDYITSEYFHIVDKVTGQLVPSSVAKAVGTPENVEITPDSDMAVGTLRHAAFHNKNVGDAAGNVVGVQNRIDFTTT